MSEQCECEHINHIEDFKVPTYLRGHKYLAEVEKTVAVRTPVGTFKVCEKCANTCYAEYTSKEKI